MVKRTLLPFFFPLLAAVPAAAQVAVDLGGFTRHYVIAADNDVDTVDAGRREIDFRRDTEIYVTGKAAIAPQTTLGIRIETDMGGTTSTDKVYAFLDSRYGRVTLGLDDGVAYLLQTAAPAADSNIDGLRTQMQALTPDEDATATQPGALQIGLPFNNRLDYDHADFSSTDRLSYVTPKINGWQAGLSYAPEQGRNLAGNNLAGMQNDGDGIGFFDSSAPADSTDAQYEHLVEAALQWEGTIGRYDLSASAAWSHAALENDGSGLAAVNVDGGDSFLSDGLTTLSAGLSAARAGWRAGAAVVESRTAQTVNTDAGVTETLRAADIRFRAVAAGISYDSGPWHAGASALYRSTKLDGIDTGGATPLTAVRYDARRYTLGGTYDLTSGVSLRASLSAGEFNAPGGDAFDNDFTQAALGTEIRF